ncbi:MAG: siderophore-interacting protein [Zhongshania sp.]|uniref:siderophore-interacting protein n=1 Tax=Zhongshania sp. TaxID=1971902 RepID=UPI00260FB365|nr:siderophore-interacting protein [Zhongshania sp.]MDF1692385.1 siderophore-interacting protein [Zhongshania sp.]
MSKPAPRTLEVIRSCQLSPHMRRVTLGGEGIASFPADQESAYIKLIFPRPNAARPLMRTYTVRHQREREIDVDFVIHEAAGPASAWARTAQKGDQILVGGPGPKNIIDTGADWFLMVGDMTALPAISVNMALLPQDARGYVVIEVLDERDIPTLAPRENLEVHWLIKPHADSSSDALLNYVASLTWLPGKVSAWVACEFSSMRQLRKYLKQTRQLGKSQLYISSYWKIGNDEDQHKVEKRQDSEQLEMANEYLPQQQATPPSSPATSKGNPTPQPSKIP